MLSWLYKGSSVTGSSGLPIPRGKTVPTYWETNSWEEKAQENPLYASMAARFLRSADPEQFSADQLKSVFQTGEQLFRQHIHPHLRRLEKPNGLVVEYGCGIGRVLRATAQAGYKCAGIDISATMLRHCRRLVPEAESLRGLDEKNRCELPDEYAVCIYSVAVLQHIATLSAYKTAVQEMCRLLKSKGVLAVQVNCEDFRYGDMDNPGRTKNFETTSEHFNLGGRHPYLTRQSTSWEGVYIGIDLLRSLLKSGGVKITDIYHHDLAREPRSIWVIGRKK